MPIGPMQVYCELASELMKQGDLSQFHGEEARAILSGMLSSNAVASSVTDKAPLPRGVHDLN